MISPLLVLPLVSSLPPLRFSFYSFILLFLFFIFHSYVSFPPNIHPSSYNCFFILSPSYLPTYLFSSCLVPSPVPVPVPVPSSFSPFVWPSSFGC
ncbi:hypothetical protein LZ31DRAFT_257053 [Colletotrichum somersetense]|nr:hypothetical protein LZ31DRAFT_257053 [Colletotrichum somersetense]